MRLVEYTNDVCAMVFGEKYIYTSHSWRVARLPTNTQWKYKQIKLIVKNNNIRMRVRSRLLLINWNLPIISYVNKRLLGGGDGGGGRRPQSLSLFSAVFLSLSPLKSSAFRRSQ